MIMIILLAMAVSMATVDSTAGTTCIRDFRKVGCFKRNAKLFNQLLITDLDKTHKKWGTEMNWSDYRAGLHSLACRCRKKAYVGNYKYFAIGKFGDCYATQNADSLEKMMSDAQEQTCISGDYGACDSKSEHECAGMGGEEYVYEVAEDSRTNYLRRDIEMQADGTMTAIAWIVIPKGVKQKGGRVGVMFGNYGNPAGDPAINFEVHDNGRLRLYWNNGEVDIFGTTDLRDGVQHNVSFERTHSGIKLFVDGRLEAHGKAGKDVPKRALGTFVGNDWREGGMSFRGNIIKLRVNDAVEVQRIRLRNDIEPKKDGTMSAEATIVIPVALKKTGGRVGVIFGNAGNPAGESAINFEVHNSGVLRLYWANGKVDIRGSTDLRDGKEHTVQFERTTTYTKLFVDGNQEASGPPGPDVKRRTSGTFVGCDWRVGGMGFRGKIISLEVNKDCWTFISGGCVSWHNIIKYSGKTVDECKTLCSHQPECVAIEYGVDHGHTGKQHRYAPHDCQLQNSVTYAGCDGNAHNLDLYIKKECTLDCWSFISGGCVKAHNIVKYSDKSVDECKALCSENSKCVGIEYGVAHGGKDKTHRPRDCQLQDSAKYAGCNGKHHNLDLYIKKDCP